MTVKQKARPKVPEKFRVIPGLSLTSKELAARLRVNSPIPGVTEDYGIPVIDELGDIRKMSNIDMMRAAVDNENEIGRLRQKLGKDAR